MERLTSPPQQTGGAILEQLSQLADPIRCRLLLLLETHELTVSELCTVMQLPQSTVSRHLKTLSDGGWLDARRDGTSRRYQLREQVLQGDQGELWSLVRSQIGESAASEQDGKRLVEVLKDRRLRSKEFFASASGQWAQHRDQLFGRRFDLAALPGLLSPDWIVGDLGVGTGQTTASIAPFVHRVIAIDESEAMLEAAASRLRGIGNVELRRGELESLPLADQTLDLGLIILVLHHLPEPPAALAEAARVIQPGGRLLVVDMLPHEHEEYRQEMGHLWLGFAPEKMAHWLGQAGFEGVRVTPLSPDPAAQGPTLFVAVATRTDVESHPAGHAH